MLEAPELDRYVMPLNCDAVEFCENREKFLVATYELNEAEKGSRGGSITLIDAQRKSFTEVTSKSAAAGVLDVKFLPTKKDQFVLPLANGSVQLGRVTPESAIEFTSSSETLSDDISLSVSCRNNDLVSAAYSSGSLRNFRITESEIKLLSCEKVHEYEAWAVLALNGRVLTGGDDCTLRSTDECGSEVMRRFDAGVTAIERDVAEHVILVGTYEDNIYKFDMRTMKRPLLEKNLGGGVWRIKENPFSSRYLAVAGMYAGAFVLDRETFDIVTHFKGHESMCYGIAWKDDTCIVSCSFYDKLVAMWETGIKE